MASHRKRPHKEEPPGSTGKKSKRHVSCYSDDEDSKGMPSMPAPWSLKSFGSDFSSSSFYNSTSRSQPAELFRKDLISAMKLPDSEPLALEDYWVISDQWKQEWEKGVQVPVNPDELPEPNVRTIKKKEKTADFKLPKRYLRTTHDEFFSNELHQMSNSPAQAEKVCRYDLDNCDMQWLNAINSERSTIGLPAIEELTMELIMEDLETQCYENIQQTIQTEEGLGIEYDEDVICDVCRSPDSEEGNEMVFCDACDICVHQACYGITSIPDGSWLCRTCALGTKPSCILCPNKGGAMKSTRSGQKWAHVSCALWIPEVSIGCVDKMEPITKISQIPASRWALVCCICRERTGACIQCSVKTCKTAYHVTCAFEDGLEMKAIVEDENDEDGVKLRSYCPKHSKNKDSMDSSDSEGEDVIKKKTTVKKEISSEEKANARALRLQQIEAEFYNYASVKEVIDALQVDSEVANFIFNYWKLKRKAGFNKALMTPKAEESDLLSQLQEDSLYARMRMFVHLRQDLERVRNLCYMVSRREKLSRSWYKLREQIFNKQLAVLTDDTLSLSDKEKYKVLHSTHGNSVYDQLHSYDITCCVKNKSPVVNNKCSASRKDINGFSKNKNSPKSAERPPNPYAKTYFNGRSQRRSNAVELLTEKFGMQKFNNCSAASERSSTEDSPKKESKQNDATDSAKDSDLVDKYKNRKKVSPLKDASANICSEASIDRHHKASKKFPPKQDSSGSLNKSKVQIEKTRENRCSSESLSKDDSKAADISSNKLSSNSRVKQFSKDRRPTESETSNITEKRNRKRNENSETDAQEVNSVEDKHPRSESSKREAKNNCSVVSKRSRTDIRSPNSKKISTSDKHPRHNSSSSKQTEEVTHKDERKSKSEINKKDSERQNNHKRSKSSLNSASSKSDDSARAQGETGKSKSCNSSSKVSKNSPTIESPKSKAASQTKVSTTPVKSKSMFLRTSKDSTETHSVESKNKKNDKKVKSPEKAVVSKSNVQKDLKSTDSSKHSKPTAQDRKNRDCANVSVSPNQSISSLKNSNKAKKETSHSSLDKVSERKDREKKISGCLNSCSTETTHKEKKSNLEKSVSDASEVPNVKSPDVKNKKDLRAEDFFTPSVNCSLTKADAKVATKTEEASHSSVKSEINKSVEKTVKAEENKDSVVNKNKEDNLEQTYPKRSKKPKTCDSDNKVLGLESHIKNSMPRDRKLRSNSEESNALLTEKNKTSKLPNDKKDNKQSAIQNTESHKTYTGDRKLRSHSDGSTESLTETSSPNKQTLAVKDSNHILNSEKSCSKERKTKNYAGNVVESVIEKVKNEKQNLLKINEPSFQNNDITTRKLRSSSESSEQICEETKPNKPASKVAEKNRVVPLERKSKITENPSDVSNSQIKTDKENSVIPNSRVPKVESKAVTKDSNVKESEETLDLPKKEILHPETKSDQHLPEKTDNKIVASSRKLRSWTEENPEVMNDHVRCNRLNPETKSKSVRNSELKSKECKPKLNSEISLKLSGDQAENTDKMTELPQRTQYSSRNLDSTFVLRDQKLRNHLKKSNDINTNKDNLNLNKCSLDLSNQSKQNLGNDILLKDHKLTLSGIEKELPSNPVSAEKNSPIVAPVKEEKFFVSRRKSKSPSKIETQELRHSLRLSLAEAHEDKTFETNSPVKNITKNTLEEAEEIVKPIEKRQKNDLKTRTLENENCRPTLRINVALHPNENTQPNIELFQKDESVAKINVTLRSQGNSLTPKIKAPSSLEQRDVIFQEKKESKVIGDSNISEQSKRTEVNDLFVEDRKDTKETFFMERKDKEEVANKNYSETKETREIHNFNCMGMKEQNEGNGLILSEVKQPIVRILGQAKDESSVKAIDSVAKIEPKEVIDLCNDTSEAPSEVEVLSYRELAKQKDLNPAVMKEQQVENKSLVLELPNNTSTFERKSKKDKRTERKEKKDRSSKRSSSDRHYRSRKEKKKHSSREKKEAVIEEIKEKSIERDKYEFRDSSEERLSLSPSDCKSTKFRFNEYSLSRKKLWQSSKTENSMCSYSDKNNSSVKEYKILKSSERDTRRNDNVYSSVNNSKDMSLSDTRHQQTCKSAKSPEKRIHQVQIINEDNNRSPRLIIKLRKDPNYPKSQRWRRDSDILETKIYSVRTEKSTSPEKPIRLRLQTRPARYKIDSSPENHHHRKHDQTNKYCMRSRTAAQNQDLNPHSSHPGLS